MNLNDFEKKYYVDRRKSLSIKWKKGKELDCLPVWIADMDFKVDERIIDSLNKVISHGAYGYSTLPENYYDKMIAFNQRRHNVTYKKEWIRFSRGAVDGINQCIRAFTKEKDGIMINPPVYGPFAQTIRDCNRTVIESKMVETDGYFTLDYKDIEKKFAKGNVKILILCTPANPAGRVWKKGELEALFELTHKYHVLVLSDEVHGDIIMKDQEFYPSLTFKKYEKEIITLSAVSKTFNLAMFANCHVIIPCARKRAMFDKYQALRHIGSPLVMNALPSYYAYQYGDEWLDNVIDIIQANYNYMKEKLGSYVSFTALEGTYLAFIDLKNICGKSTGYDFLVNKCHVLPNNGADFDKKYGSYVRINLATSRVNIKKVCDSILKQIKK